MQVARSLCTELALLALLALLWGSSYLFIKIAIAEIPPVTLIAARVLGAALFSSIGRHAKRKQAGDHRGAIGTAVERAASKRSYFGLDCEARPLRSLRVAGSDVGTA